MSEENTSAPAEQNNEDLNRLMAEAAAVDAEHAPKPIPEVSEDGATSEQAAQPINVIETDPVEEAAEIIELLCMGLGMLNPVLTYTDTVKETGAKKLAPLLVKYNVKGLLFAKYAAEIEAGIFFGSVVVGSIAAVKQSKLTPVEQAEQPKKSWWKKFFHADK